MGKHAEISKDKRLLFVHQHLTRGARVTAEWLSERLGVSTKTAQRDIRDLNEEIGDLVRWDSGAKTFKYMDVVTLQNRFFICGEEEVTAFLLACAVMQGFTSIPLGAEMDRLRQAFLSEKYNRLAFNQPNVGKYSFVHPRMARVDPKIWKICVSALNACHKLDIVYQKLRAKPEKRRIIPLHLRGAKGGWYLVSYCELAEAQRTFHMSRIREAEDTGEQFSPANYKFDADQYFCKKTDIFKAGAYHQCEVRLMGWAVERIKEMTYFDGQKLTEHKNGSATLCFETEDLFTAADFVMSMAGGAKALKPRALVDKVRENVRALAGVHGIK